MIISVKTDNGLKPVMWIQEGIFPMDEVWKLIRIHYEKHKTHELKIEDEYYADTCDFKIIPPTEKSD